MSVDTFRPEVWAAELLLELRNRLVYGSVANRQYEGEIRDYGDTVNINSISRPTVATYTPNSTTITPEQLTTAQRKLLIDQAKYFAFEIDDVDARQVRGDLIPQAMSESAYALSDVADGYIASLYVDAQAANTISATAVTSGAIAYSQLNKLRTKLDEASVPKSGRWAILPPWYVELLLEDDRLVRLDASGSQEGLREGMVGRMLGFDIWESNNTPTLDSGDDSVVVAGYPGAISYAEQIAKVEAYRPEDGFADAVKGLHLYGAKVVRPDGIATLQASKS
ncbi:MAG: P22 phage major capsid protein family protein, partial [Miltoncostaeaceae bacterium]